MNGTNPFARQLWDQQPDEPDEEYEAFQLFMALGPARSLEKVAELLADKEFMRRWRLRENRPGHPLSIKEKGERDRRARQYYNDFKAAVPWLDQNPPESLSEEDRARHTEVLSDIIENKYVAPKERKIIVRWLKKVECLEQKTEEGDRKDEE